MHLLFCLARFIRCAFHCLLPGGRGLGALTSPHLTSPNLNVKHWHSFACQERHQCCPVACLKLPIQSRLKPSFAIGNQSQSIGMKAVANRPAHLHDTGGEPIVDIVRGAALREAANMATHWPTISERKDREAESLICILTSENGRWHLTFLQE